MKITDRCKLNCTYCYEKATRGIHGDMTLETFKKIVTDIRPHDSITYHGGEPTLIGIDKFLEMQKILKCGGYLGSQSMQTSGIGLSDKWIEQLIKHDINCSVSIDFTDSRDRQITLKDVQRLLAAGLEVGVLVVIHRDNVHRLIEMYESLEDAGVRAMAFNLIYEGGDLQVSPEIHYKEFKKFYKYLINRGDIKERNMLQHYSNYKNLGYRLNCSPDNCIKEWVTILPNGEVYPCDRSGARDFQLRYGETLQNVFEGNDYVRYLNRVRNTMQTCSLCDIKSFCKGSCVFHHNLNTGELSRYECVLARNIYNILQDTFNRRD